MKKFDLEAELSKIEQEWKLISKDGKFKVTLPSISLAFRGKTIEEAVTKAIAYLEK